MLTTHAPIKPQPNTGLRPEALRFDIEAILSLALVREHCKVDDNMTVSDAILSLYRKAAIEAAEAYTGLFISRQQYVTEYVPNKQMNYEQPEYQFVFKTKRAFASEIAWYYGFEGITPEQIRVRIGTKKAILPIIQANFGFNCCKPGHTSEQGQFMYLAGYDCLDSIPAAFALGALKYIAHVIENPGDLVVAATESGAIARGLVVGTAANPVIASGAAEIWRMMVPDSI
jgi:hypothetical protein